MIPPDLPRLVLGLGAIMFGMFCAGVLVGCWVTNWVTSGQDRPCNPQRQALIRRLIAEVRRLRLAIGW